MPSTPPRRSYRPPPSHRPPSGGFPLPDYLTRVSAPPSLRQPAEDVYRFLLDGEVGLLVGRRGRGSHAVAAPLIAEAQHRFDMSPGRLHQPKVHMLLVDSDVEPPDARTRRAYALSSMATTGLFVVVSSSPMARVAALSIAAMKGPEGALHSGFASFDLALDWIDERRPGVRFRLSAMRDKLLALPARALTYR